MPTPSSRTPVRIARGTYSNLNSSIADIQEGEICYATDQNRCYVKEGNALVSVTPDSNLLATLASPTFTGTPAAPTASAGTNTTQIATTAYVQGESFAKTNVAQSFSKGQRGTPVALTDAASVVVDLSLGNNFTLLCTSSVGATRALANPTNAVAGQSGLITVTQASGGGNALTFSSNYKFAGGSPGAPQLTTNGNAVDVLPYTVKSTTEIVIGKPLSDVK